MAVLTACWTTPALAQPRPPRKVELPAPSDVPRFKRTVTRTQDSGPADYKSAHFLLHTDLKPKVARELLSRLETMLTLVSKYWDRPLAGTIECYVVENLDLWPADTIAEAGREKIAQRAGITLVESLNYGKKLVAAQAVVYATADRGTPQHEAVHAYCGQTFGRTGPLWYSEGMAELGQYWRPNDSSVQCPDYVIAHLRSNRPKPLRQILSEDGADRPGRPAATTGDSWQNYAWRWALCHLLVHNPNYSQRFRTLGLAYLNGSPARFADVYGAAFEELAFEYRFFLDHVDNGYRVDLCGWDWDRKFREASAVPIATRVAAGRGWQPSGARVTAGEHYHVSATGAWRTADDAEATSAAGRYDGAGRLEGVVLVDYQLGEPFALSDDATFIAPASGKLYLRCADAWHEVADNSGAVNVRVTTANAAQPLPKPPQPAPDPPRPGDAE